MSASLMAIPAYRGAIKAQQPDGTTIEIFQQGDEHFHYITNANGEWLVKNSDGYYVVTEALTPQQINERRMASPMLKSQIQRAKRRTPINLNISQYGLIILVNFSDLSFQSENTLEAMDEMHNGDNYTYNGATGSARKYFYDQSMGKYNPTFDVVGPVTLSNVMSYYGGNDSTYNDKNAGGMIVEACQLADQQFDVDFTKYDNDGDGEVDFVYVVYAGQGEADTGIENTVWPHQWDLTSAGKSCNLDGKKINNYACGSELNSDKKRCGIGTFCHEFSHVCGLPDLYSTDADNDTHKTMGSWDILDNGPYNNDGNTPPSYSAYERFFCGWLTPTYINENANISFQDLQISNKAFIITTDGEPNLLGNDPNPTTFWLLENRQQSGWDTYLPGHGLMITKVSYDYDKWHDNNVNSTASAMGVDIIEADGKAPKLNYGKATDLFPAGATAYRGISDHAITDIIEKDGVVSFKLMDGLSTTFRQLSVFANDDEAGSVFGAGSYYENNEVVLLATANKGYDFLQWSDGVTDNPRWVMPADTFYLAQFSVAPTVVDTVVDEPDSVTVRFYADWDSVNVYIWSSNVDIPYLWPGKPIEKGDDGWYSVEIEAGTNVIFNDGMLQTVDILSVVKDVCYELGELQYYSEKIYTVVENTDCQLAEPDSVTVRFYADWDSVNVYIWSSNVEIPYQWPGKPIEKGNDGWYSVEIEAGTNVIFNDGMLQTVDILSVVKDVCYELGELYYSEKIYTVVENTDCQLILEPQPSFKLTLNVNDTTMGWVYGGGAYTNDTTVTITAEPGDLFVFDYWTNGTDKFYDKEITINLTQDTTFTAYFSPWLVDVSYTVQGSYPSYDIYNISVIRSGNDKFTIYLTDDLKREILAGLERSFDSYCYEFRYNYNLGGYYLDIDEYYLEQEFFDIDFKNERWYYPLTDTLYNGRLDVDLPANERYIFVYAGASDDTMGSASASSDYLSCYNTSVDVYAVPKDGYQFVRWTDSRGNTFTDNPHNLIFDSFAPDDDSYYDITAEFEPIVVELDSFTVTFLDWNGNILSTQMVGQGMSAVAPNAPYKEFYNFIGWDGDFSNVQSDLIITALYEKIAQNTYHLDFYINGEIVETLTEIQEGTIIDQSWANEVWALVKDNYKTACGYDSIQWMYVEPFEIHNDTMLWATIQPVLYFVSVISQNDSMGMVNQSGNGYYECGSTISIDAVPYEGYRFVGWSDGNTDNPRLLEFVADIPTLIALFEPIPPTTFTITFLTADGLVLDQQTVSKDSAAIAPQAPEIEGYTFVGWNTDFSNVRSDLVVTAQYERIYLTVLFFGFNGELLGEQQVAYGDSAVALVAPEIEGYRFIGWNTDFSSVKSETIITAQYERIYLTVQFYGFNGELLGEQQVAYGDSAVALVAPEIEGYRFIGWNTDFSSVKSETIVTAQYERIYFNVQFFGFEGVLIDSQQVAYGEDAVEPEVPEVDGYYFTEWDADFHNVYSNLTINAQYQLCLLDYGTIQDAQNDLYWQLNCKNTLDISGSGDYVVDENNDIIDETVDINLNPGTALIVDGEVEQEVNTITQHIDMTSAASIIACEDRFLGSVLKVKFTIQTNVWYFLYFPFDVPFAQIQSPGQYAVYEYDGKRRATQGYGGWVRTHDKVESHKGYIYQASTAGELIITVPVPLFSCSTIEKVLPVHSADYIFDANWILAGNPYPSYFDMDTLFGAGFNAPIYVRNKNADDYIAVRPQDDDYHFHPYEAFFVQNPDKEMETIMNWYSNGRETESQIRNQHGRYMRREAVRRTRQSEQQRYFVELNLTDGSNDDHTRVVFNETATADYDLGTDAIKMEGSAPVRIFTLDEQVQYAINERPLTDQPIHVGYTVANSGVYTLSAMRWDSDVELYDNELDQRVDFTNGDYMFYTTAGTNTTRFSLIGKNNVPTDIDNVGEADGRVSIFSITGALIYDNVMLDDVKLQSGVYLIKTAREVKKVVIK